MRAPHRTASFSLLAAALAVSACATAPAVPPPVPPVGPDGKPTSAVTPSGLKVEALKDGTGPKAVEGSVVAVHYVGTLLDGKKFDSSRDRGQPFRFTLGLGEVIEGWDEGVLGMQVGAIRRLTVPPALGYGRRGFGDVIPPDATLVFEIELVELI